MEIIILIIVISVAILYVFACFKLYDFIITKKEKKKQTIELLQEQNKLLQELKQKE